MTDENKSGPLGQLVNVVEEIQKNFKDFRDVNDKMISEEKAGNDARARELQDTLDKINDELSKNHKTKDALEKRLAMQSDRLEILEAIQDRPGKTVADKIKEEHKGLMVRWLRNKGQDQEAEKEFEKLSAKAREVKDVTVGTGSAGGFGVPEEISRQIDKLLLKTSPVAEFVKNVTVGTPDYKELVSVNGLTYAWSSETGTRSAKVTPTLRERAITHGELYSYLAASNWSLRDPFFSVENWLVENAVEGFGVGLSAAIWNGDGSSKPTGFIQGTPATNNDYASPERAHGALEYLPITVPSSPQASSGMTADTIIDLHYLLNPRYRANARFAANTVTQGHIRKFKDSNGQYLWQPSLQAGQPDRLLGYELFTWEEMGDPTTANAFPLAFGDFNKTYTLALITGMEIVRDNVTVPGYTNFYLARRFGGIVTNNHAMKLAKVED